MLDELFGLVSPELPPSQRRLLYHAFPGPPTVCTCQPDAACRLAVPRDISNAQAGTTDVVGLFEIDCSSEGRKQIVNKLPGYTRLIAQRAFLRYFRGTENAVVRVFWVCRTEGRIASLCQKLAGEPVAQYFRFALASDVTTESVLTSPIWRSIDGMRREIIRLPQSTKIASERCTAPLPRTR